MMTLRVLVQDANDQGREWGRDKLSFPNHRKNDIGMVSLNHGNQQEENINMEGGVCFPRGSRKAVIVDRMREAIL